MAYKCQLARGRGNRVGEGTRPREVWRGCAQVFDVHVEALWRAKLGGVVGEEIEFGGFKATVPVETDVSGVVPSPHAPVVDPLLKDNA